MIKVPGEITRLLQRISEGDREEFDQLLPLVYAELRALAAVHLQAERSDHTLQPTALVHEAWLKLTANSRPQWVDRRHFFRASARVMRFILVDHARKHRRQKRGGSAEKIPLTDGLLAYEERAIDLVALDDALAQLTEFAPRQADLIELRFFAGLTTEEAADVLNISVRTAHGDWRLARAWLLRELTAG